MRYGEKEGGGAEFLSFDYDLCSTQDSMNLEHRLW